MHWSVCVWTFINNFFYYLIVIRMLHILVLKPCTKAGSFSTLWQSCFLYYPFRWQASFTWKTKSTLSGSVRWSCKTSVSCCPIRSRRVGSTRGISSFLLDSRVHGTTGRTEGWISDANMSAGGFCDNWFLIDKWKFLKTSNGMFLSWRFIKQPIMIKWEINEKTCH